MSGRYEIFDILAQNADGVVFHAEDRQSGSEVVLRRFFPFGADQGGLEGEERTAYEIAVHRLVKVTHPALRSVIAGGTDPIDGMPFLVTEWVPGTLLSKRLEQTPLSPGSALALADLAIETSMALSETFGEEAIWIDTNPESIVLSEGNSERPVTFWISPLRWLGEANHRHGLRPLLEMIEQVTGWHGRVISETSGNGLGAWIMKIRANPDIWNLAQARYALHHGVDAVPPPTATQKLCSATPTQAARAQTADAASPMPSASNQVPIAGQATALHFNWWPWALTGGLVLIVACLMIWQGLRSRSEPPQVTATPPDGSSSPAALASQRAAKLSDILTEQSPILPEGVTIDLPTPEQNAQLINLGRQLRNQLGYSYTLSARLYQIRASKSGKTLYLEFGSSTDPDALCVRHRTKDSSLTQQQLQNSVGKIVRIQGKIVADPSGRIAIDLASAEQLETLPE